AGHQVQHLGAARRPGLDGHAAEQELDERVVIAALAQRGGDAVERGGRGGVVGRGGEAGQPAVGVVVGGDGGERLRGQQRVHGGEGARGVGVGGAAAPGG